MPPMPMNFNPNFFNQNVNLTKMFENFNKKMFTMLNQYKKNPKSKDQKPVNINQIMTEDNYVESVISQSEADKQNDSSKENKIQASPEAADQEKSKTRVFYPKNPQNEAEILPEIEHPSAEKPPQKKDISTLPVPQVTQPHITNLNPPKSE
jgi:hypothetical protein